MRISEPPRLTLRAPTSKACHGHSLRYRWHRKAEFRRCPILFRFPCCCIVSADQQRSQGSKPAEYHFKQQLLIQVARHVNCNKKQQLKKLEGKVRGLVVHRTQQTGRRIIAGKTLDHRPLACVGLVCRRDRRAASSFHRRNFPFFLKKKTSNGIEETWTGKVLFI